MLEMGLVFEMLRTSNFHQTVVNQLMYCYNESAIVRIKWGKAFCERIGNHSLMHYVSEMEILPHQQIMVLFYLFIEV